MTAADDIQIERQERVLVLRFNRPDKKNAITHAMYETLATEMAAAETDDSIRAIVFSGVGECFTAGNDLVDFRDNPPLGTNTPVARFLSALNTSTKPYIGAVHGKTVGIGLTMLLHFDLVCVTPTTRLSVPFVDLALVPEAASSELLPERVGRAMAADMFLTGRALTGEEAVSVGLASRLVEDDQVEAEALKVATEIAHKAPEAVRLARAMIKPDETRVAELFMSEGRLFQQRLQSPEFMEAAMAFMQRRPPNFG